MVDESRESSQPSGTGCLLDAYGQGQVDDFRDQTENATLAFRVRLAVALKITDCTVKLRTLHAGADKASHTKCFGALTKDVRCRLHVVIGEESPVDENFLCVVYRGEVEPLIRYSRDILRRPLPGKRKLSRGDIGFHEVDKIRLCEIEEKIRGQIGEFLHV